MLETLKSPSNLQITILLDGLPSLGHLGAGRGTTAYAAAPDGKAEWCLSSSSPDTKHTVLRGPAGLPLPEHQLSTLGPSIRPIYIYRLQTESRVMKTQSCLKDRWKQGTGRHRPHQEGHRYRVNCYTFFLFLFFSTGCLSFFGTTDISFLAPQ